MTWIHRQLKGCNLPAVVVVVSKHGVELVVVEGLSKKDDVEIS
jgi:hypothetical protein